MSDGRRKSAAGAVAVVTAALVAALGSAGTASAAGSTPAPPFGECPAIGHSPSCEILLVVNADNSVTVLGDPSVGTFDGSDDTLVGIVNDSSSTVKAVTVTGPGSGLSGFDGDGICSGDYGAWSGSANCPYGPTGYEGTGTSVVTDPSLPDSAEVDFKGGLAPNGTAYFSLEGALTSAELTAREGPLKCQGVTASGVGSASGGGTPDYCIPADWDAHTPTDALIAGPEPLNVIIGANSTVTPTQLLAALGGWQAVGIGNSPFARPPSCISAEYANVTDQSNATPVAQAQSWRFGGCVLGNIDSLAGLENHARLWNQPVPGSPIGGAWFVTASYETACLVTSTGTIIPLKKATKAQLSLPSVHLWHCIDGSKGSLLSNGYNVGAVVFVSSVKRAAAKKGWSVQVRYDERASGSSSGLGLDSGAGAGLGGVAYSNQVAVLTITG